MPVMRVYRGFFRSRPMMTLTRISFDFQTYYFSSRAKLLFTQRLNTIGERTISLLWPGKISKLTGRGCEKLNNNTNKNNREIGWLWQCFNCKNNLRMNAKLELQWDNACQQCCAKSTKVLRERIHATDVDLNQIRTVQYLLINKLVQIENDCDSKESSDSELPDIFSESFSERSEEIFDVEEFDENFQTEIDRTPRNFNPTWDEAVRLPPRGRQCRKCGGNMKPRGDSWICRECGEEEI